MKSKRKVDTKRIGLTVDLETYNQIKLIAFRQNKSMSEIVRLWAIKELNGQVSRDNIDLITKIMREEIKNMISPSVERLAALSAKTCVQASTAAYLNAEALATLVPLELQKDVKEIYEMARKKGVMYTKAKAE